MRVLITSSLSSVNSTINDLYQHLSPYVKIQASVESFWDKAPSLSYDIIHIQWPEELFSWRPIADADLKKLIKQLEWWKDKGSKIIITRHNVHPHVLNDLYKVVYKIIYEKVSAIVHFSEVSIKNFNSIYDGDLAELEIIHRVIYHPMYDGVENNCSRKEARDFLKIKGDKRVILIFGAIRSKDEQDFALSVFNSLDETNKFMIVPRWFSLPNHNVLQKLAAKINTFFNMFSKDTILQDYLVPESEIQLYMNASDIVFIPRFEVLNSGVIMLAFSFNKVVVGPSTGSIGELLELSNNPVYQVGDINDAVSKISKGLELSKQQVGNHSFIKKNMNWDLIIEKYMLLYAEVVE